MSGNKVNSESQKGNGKTNNGNGDEEIVETVDDGAVMEDSTSGIAESTT